MSILIDSSDNEEYLDDEESLHNKDSSDNKESLDNEKSSNYKDNEYLINFIVKNVKNGKFKPTNCKKY